MIGKSLPPLLAAADGTAALLSVCLVAQLGIPEVWLYKRVSWLGPQSTPIPLGMLQAM